MPKNLFILVITISLCWPGASQADEVGLSNGNVLTGIVIKETEDAVGLEVSIGASITFSKQDVAYIKRWDQEQNQELTELWQREREERSQAELARQKFEARQKARGLVKYRGKWIAETDKKKMETKEYIDSVLKAKLERGEIAQSTDSGRTKVARTILTRGNWHYRTTEHFIVYYEDLMQSKIVADRAEYYYEKIAYDLDYDKSIYWPQKCEVFIIPSEEKWEEYMRGLVRRFDHIGGFVPSTGEKEIYLCTLSLPYLSVTFPHELTHLIFAEFAGGAAIPLWLNEGLAIYESGLIGYADEMLREKVKQAEHMPLKDMLESEDYPQSEEGMKLYYAQAEKTVEFLITQHGRKRFSRLCRLLFGGQSFAKALNLAYGDVYYNQDEFQRAWIKYILK
ncbi:peptidase MA family metallohydrolase [Candidatus Omnitrophota bacterium]